MPDIESVGSALLITLGFVTVSLFIVVAVMSLVYRLFKNNDDNNSTDTKN